MRRRHANGDDGARAILMNLKRPVPEVLREMMLTNEKTTVRRVLRPGESERERQVGLGAIRTTTFSLEEERLKRSDPFAGEQRRIRFGVGAVQDEHRKPLALAQIIANERAEAE